MSLLTEFRVSLKTVEAEEIIDLVIFRPISFIFVKLIYSTSITPNQISVVSLLFGVVTGILYGFADYKFYIAASICFFICNTLDCVDGQLARLKRNGTKIGRIVDGFIDYITSVSIFLGLGVALSITTGNALYSWVLVVSAGVSKALQNMYFDQYRNMYLEYVYNKASNIDDDIKEYTIEKKLLAENNGSKIDRMLVDAYLLYCRTQKKTSQAVKLYVSPNAYKRKNKFLLRMWSWIGSTTHMAALIIFSIINNVEGYLYLSITLGNALLIILLYFQSRVLASIKKV